MENSNGGAQSELQSQAQYMTTVVRMNIKQIIKEKGISQRDLAKSMGTNPSTFSQMLNGNRRLLVEDVFALSLSLGVSINDLMDDSAIREGMREQAEMLISQANSLRSRADELTRQMEKLPNPVKSTGELAGSPRYLRKPDETEERGQANGPRMFMMPDLEVSGYMEKALRHSPQGRLGMGSPTWTRAEVVFWLIIMYVLFLRMQCGSCFDPVDPFRENGFLLIGQADEQTEEQDGVEGDRRV